MIEEEEVTVGMTLDIFKDVLYNQNVRKLLLFVAMSRMSYSIFQQVGEVYLTNDLGYDKARLSSIKVICTPINILLTMQFGFVTKDKAFLNLWKLAICYTVACSYAILVLFNNLPVQD